MSEWDAFPVASEGGDRLRITVRPSPKLEGRSRDLVVRTVLGEAANEPDDGQAAVAAVIRNRLESGKWGDDAARVVLAPSQFEPWMTGQGRSKMMSYTPDSPAYQRAAAAVDRAFADERFDPTNGSTHFFSPSAQSALGRQPPKWAQGEPQMIGRHAFYAPEGRARPTDVSAQSKQSGDPWAAFPVADSAPQPTAPQPAPAQPSAPDIGQGTAALEGYLSGASANFRDEIYGASKASGLPDALGGFRAPVGAAKMFYEWIQRNPGEATKIYEQAVAEKRGVQKQAQEQYPGTNLAGNIVGAVALPAGRLLQAPTLAGRAFRGAGVGAAYGGAAGVGEGTTAEERATRGAVGVGLGGLAGGIGVPVVEGVTRGIGAAVSRPVNMVRAAVNPQGAAERAVGRAYNEAVTADPAAVNRLRPNEVVPGGPQTVMDTLGGPGRDLSRSAANLSGGARDALNHTLNDRFENQANRLTTWLRNTFHHPDAHAQQQAIDNVERTVNRAAYARAYREGDRGLWSPELERLASSPDVVSAMREAATKGKSRAVTQGFGGFNPGVTFDNGILTFQRGPNGVPSYPTLQFWDYTKRAIDDAANAARRSGRNDESSVLTSLSQTLRGELDRMVPSYGQARAGAAAFFGAENALEAGQRFVTQNFAIPQTRAALARMTPAERQLFQDGFVSRFVETLEQIPDRADVVRRVYNSPAAQQKIELALGPQRARELEAILRVENIMQQGLRGVQGNSTTVQQLAGFGLAGAAGGGLLGFDPTGSGIAAALASAGKRGIDTRVATRVAEMLTSTDPAVLQRGIRMLANNQRMMGALRSADSAAARVSGGQAQAIPVPALQLPAPGRAEDEPKIPRPPGQ